MCFIFRSEMYLVSSLEEVDVRSAIGALLHGIVARVSRIPLWMWVYFVFVGYLYRRMMRDFLGVGTKRKRILGRVTLDLTREEEKLADNIINPAAITETFSSVGGLEDAKTVLTESVIWPFTRPDLFPPGSLRSHPTGLLLHGPPGTGKTLLARALAKELDSFFLEVNIEQLFSKWVGESEKLASAVFSLAHKLPSCVIFIDEVDALLSSRVDGDSTVYLHAKTIFMSKWDGLCAESGQGRVLVVGATNRPLSLDEAVIRRMPIRLSIDLPDTNARVEILRILLKDELAPELSIDAIARATEGYSGSDLKELCKQASLIMMRSVMAKQKSPKSSSVAVQSPNDHPSAPPSLTLAHFKEALKRVLPGSDMPV